MPAKASKSAKTTKTAKTTKATETTNLADNPHVQELFAIMKENDKDTAGLTALLSYVKQMEDYVKSAESQISDMKSQISELKEIQKHPIKTSLGNASKSLESKVTDVRAQLDKVRSGIVEACKNAVQVVKDNGTIALDKLSGFFHIKQGFEAIQKDTTDGMNRCDKSVDNIERFSTEYHKAGRSLKNLARMSIGKEPIETPKDIGKLAKAMCAPYRLEKKCLNSICSTANKAIDKLEDLGKNADKIKQERLEQKKPSIDEKMATLEEKANQKNIDKAISFPTSTMNPKSATAGVEL